MKSHKTEMSKKQYIKETTDHIFNVGQYIYFFIQELQLRANNHDKTKLSSPEKEGFIEYAPKLKASTYGSGEYKKLLKELKEVLVHHYEHNQHHPEHFKNGIKDMNLIDIIEMLCDWKAATLRHEDGDLIKSIELNQERMGYSDDLKKIFINTGKLLK